VASTPWAVGVRVDNGRLCHGMGAPTDCAATGGRASCLRSPSVTRRVSSSCRADLVPRWCQTWPIHRAPSILPITRKARQFAQLGVLDPGEFAPRPGFVISRSRVRLLPRLHTESSGHARKRVRAQSDSLVPGGRGLRVGHEVVPELLKHSIHCREPLLNPLIQAVQVRCRSRLPTARTATGHAKALVIYSQAVAIDGEPMATAT